MKIRFLMTASAVGIAAASFAPSTAFAQSTGSIDFEEETIIVTGTRAKDVGGVELPDTPKAKQVLTEEIIRRQRPGQTVNDIVNLIPGVSFQNNDPWGSAGGSFTIRGFGSDRISQTVDGIPLNDSGNYLLYTNQQLDPEVLESVNVNLGVTDVDSPTASAVGGTINIRSRKPSEEWGITSVSSVGDIFAKGKGGQNGGDRSRLSTRQFVMINTGDITGKGTTAWASASIARSNNPFNNYGKNEKQQLNAKIHQAIGNNGDFIAIAGHYNQNRNNFFGSFAMDKIPTTKEERFYDIGDERYFKKTEGFPCATDVPQANVNDKADSCGTEFDRRYNPSNTGNLRVSSKFTLSDKMVLTVDPSFQYVKANGGGTTTAFEKDNKGLVGYIGGKPYVGVDLNGDGDVQDEVTVLAPSQTVTNRFGVITNLSYEINDGHSVRFSYTHDNANHRQTGEVGLLQANGEPFDAFPVNNGVLDKNGNRLQKRDRQSYAILNQFSGEYRGTFDTMTLVLGARMPFFKRELNNYCFTTSAGGNTDCFGGDPTANAAYAATLKADTKIKAPVSRVYNYKKFLPNIGFTSDLGAASLFGNYAKGISVPGTDPLYNSLYFVEGTKGIQPAPETTDSFDMGLRMRRGKLTAQATGWYTKYQNRIASTYDPVLTETIYRNLGRVNKYGIDGSISWQANEYSMFYVFGSYKTSEIKSNVLTGKDKDTGVLTYAKTAGKEESGSSNVMFGTRGQFKFGDFEFGVQAKHTGKAWVNDINNRKVNGYTLVDLDVRYKIAEFPTGGDVAVQLNVSNLLDKYYVGRASSLDSAASKINLQLGAPRAATLSLLIGY